jgi:hypothetical protein
MRRRRPTGDYFFEPVEERLSFSLAILGRVLKLAKSGYNDNFVRIHSILSHYEFLIQPNIIMDPHNLFCCLFRQRRTSSLFFYWCRGHALSGFLLVNTNQIGRKVFFLLFVTERLWLNNKRHNIIFSDFKMAGFYKVSGLIFPPYFGSS